MTNKPLSLPSPKEQKKPALRTMIFNQLSQQAWGELLPLPSKQKKMELNPTPDLQGKNILGRNHRIRTQKFP